MMWNEARGGAGVENLTLGPISALHILQEQMRAVLGDMDMKI